ncbi:MAG: hypothetical protein NTU49_00005, partial [Gammaproteobacteria bacterium]|nr:hypothetical protein [Gammaproteobacteria bacterium]
MRKVGIHLNAFPLASEVFVNEQARTLTRYEPIFFVREQVKPFEDFLVLPIKKNARGALRKKLFSFFP